MARIKLDGDSAGLVAAQRKVRNETKRMDDEFNKVLETNRDLERQVKRAFEQARPLVERFNDKIRRLNDLRKQNRITEQEHKRAVEQTTQAYRRLQKEQDGSFGARAGRQIAGYINSLDGVSMAVGQLRMAFAELEQFQETQADKERQRLQDLAKLYTLPGTAQERAERVRQAVSLEEAGVPAEARPGSLIFGLSSVQGMNTAENRALVREIANVPGFFEDTGQTLVDAGKLITNLPDVDTLNEALGRLQAVSSVSQAEVTAIGRAAPNVAGLAGQQGILSGEALGALSVLSDALKSPDKASEQLAGLLKEFQKGNEDFDLTGRTLDERLSKVASVVESGQASLNDIFTTDTARMAATFLLRDRTEMRRRAGVIEAAPGIRDAVRQVVDDPTIGMSVDAERRRRIAEFRGREAGEMRVRTEAALQAQIADTRERAPGAVTPFISEQAARFVQARGGDEGLVSGASEAAEFAQQFNPLAQAESGIARMIALLTDIRANTNTGPVPSGQRQEN